MPPHRSQTVRSVGNFQTRVAQALTGKSLLKRAARVPRIWVGYLNKGGGKI